MPASKPTIRQEIKRYLRTGHSDIMHRAWPGTFAEKEHNAHRDLRARLEAEVYKIAGNRPLKVKLTVDPVALTRRKVEPMIRGFFPKAEQRTVLGVIEKSVVFLTPENMMLVLRDTSWDKTAWDLANLYLASLGAKLLGKDAPDIVGLSEGTTCYVSMTYFAENDPFADFVVHEAAHIFHNCKRRNIGLRETRRREWLLPIEYRMRETFAYSCEAYARVLERATTPTQRRQLAAKFASKTRITDERVDPMVVGDIVTNAAAARNGWKVILARCGAPVRQRQANALGGSTTSAFSA